MKTFALRFFCVVFAALSSVNATRRRAPDDSRRRSEETRRRASEEKATKMKACWLNTGGTCNVLGCKDWRGETTCYDYLCQCGAGYCSDRDGACQKDTGTNIGLVKESVLIRSVHDPKYVLYVDGCGDPQDNNKIDIEEGHLKVRENFDGPESRFDIYQLPPTKDGRRGYFLVSKAFPNCVATLGLVKSCVNVYDDDEDRNRDDCDNHIRGVNEPFEALWEGWKAGPWTAAMAFEKDGSYKIRSLRWTHYYMGMSRVGWVVQNMIETFNSNRVRWTFDPPMDSLVGDVFNMSAQQEDIDFV